MADETLKMFQVIFFHNKSDRIIPTYHLLEKSYHHLTTNMFPRAPNCLPEKEGGNEGNKKVLYSVMEM